MPHRTGHSRRRNTECSIVLTIVALGSAGGGCTSGPGGNSTFEGTGPAPSSSSDTSSSTGASEPSSGALDESTTAQGGDGIKLDLGAVGSTGELEGCKGIDFLFVVDNSNSMAGYQQALASSVPGFIDTISTTASSTDFHVMVVDTDARSLPSFDCGNSPWAEQCAATLQACLAGATNPSEEQACGQAHSQCVFDCCDVPCSVGNPGGQCGGAACAAPPVGATCDDTMGAGVVRSGTGMPCGLAPTTRFLRTDAPAFAETFACMASPGATSLWQWPMQAMTSALSGALTGPDGCNAGFVRDDAILVVISISDEDEPPPAEHPWPSSGDPASWRAALVDAKQGDEAAVVFLAIGPGGGTPVEALAASFGERGFYRSVYEPDYGPLLDEVVSTIDLTCDDFVPPG